jgi:hypothetical protein
MAAAAVDHDLEQHGRAPQRLGAHVRRVAIEKGASLRDQGPRSLAPAYS